MTTRTISCFILIFFTTLCFCQNLSRTEQLEDLNNLKNNLYSVHPSLYRFTSKHQLDSLFSEIEESLTENTSINQFSHKLSPIFSTIQDAHTWQRIPKKDAGLQFPFDIKIISNELYIKNNLSSNTKCKRGYKIVSIQNESSESILQRLFNQVSTDGGITTTKTRVVEEWFRHVYDTKDLSVLNVSLNDGKKVFNTKVNLIESRTIDSIRSAQKFNSTDKLSPPFYSFKIENGIGYLKIVHFAPIPWNEYTSFLDQSIDTLNQQHIKNLILDLRWNIGGPRDYPIYLYSKLTNQPFHYVDHLITKQSTVDANIPFDSTKNYHPLIDDFYKVTEGARGLGLQQPHNTNYLENIYLLVDGQSNSSSAQIASMIKSNSRGVIIGEEAGGLYSGGTGEYHCHFNLEHSKIHIQIPRYRIVLAVDETKNDLNKGTLPDYPIKETYNSFIKGEDLYLKKALELIQF